jgi:hypothetical protein
MPNGCKNYFGDGLFPAPPPVPFPVPPPVPFPVPPPVPVPALGASAVDVVLEVGESIIEPVGLAEGELCEDGLEVLISEFFENRKPSENLRQVNSIFPITVLPKIFGHFFVDPGIVFTGAKIHPLSPDGFMTHDKTSPFFVTTLLPRYLTSHLRSSD